MSTNTKNKISVIHLLSLIPTEELDKIAEKTNVNRYVKVLDGQSVLYLLLYALGGMPAQQSSHDGGSL